MKLIKIIIDQTNNKVFGQSVKQDEKTGKNTLSVHEYKGFCYCYDRQKVIDNKSITIYDLRL